MNTSSLEYQLNLGDSLAFYFTGTPGTYPFADNEISNRTGDSVIIRFIDNRCVTYTLNKSSGTYGGNGVFDLKEYDNYSQDLVNQKSYTLRYTIDSTDYKRAVPCK